MTGILHVVGAGLAGLSAALTAIEQGRAVRVYEGAGHAGGRCRSFFDKKLDRQIDNGNHLVLSGNDGVRRYLARAGAPDALVQAPQAIYPFVDLRTGERWSVHLNDGPIPFWAFDASRRPKGVGLGELAGASSLFVGAKGKTIAELVSARGPVWDRFWEPMSLAVMNLPPERASAELLRAVFVRTFFRDGRRSRPMFAPNGLGPALVDPAVEKIAAAGTPVAFNRLVTQLDRDADRITRLDFAAGDPVEIGSDDDVILAVPPARLQELYPDAAPPLKESAILNAHFVLPDPALASGLPPLVAVLGGISQWIFPHGDVISITVSSSQDIEGADARPDELLETLWREVVTVFDFPPDTVYQAGRLLREKRATFEQTPEAVAQRPAAKTALTNLYLAGDVTDTGLPATIEGAVRSGESAAQLAGQAIADHSTQKLKAA